MSKVSNVLAAVPYSWANDGKEYAIKVTDAESKADKYRLGHLFDVADKSGLEVTAVSSFLEGCKTGFEGIYTENTAKSRLTELRRFFKVFAIKADSLTEAKASGMGYHAVMNLCNDLAQENGLSGKGGAPNKEKKAAKEQAIKEKGDSAPQKHSAQAEYDYEELAHMVESLTETQCMYVASRLAAQCAKYDGTKDFGADLHTVLVAHDELEPSGDTLEAWDNEDIGEVRSLLQQVA